MKSTDSVNAHVGDRFLTIGVDTLVGASDTKVNSANPRARIGLNFVCAYNP